MVRVNRRPKHFSGTQVITLNGDPLPADLEFQASKRIRKTFSECGLGFGRCLGSKSRYREVHPGNQFIPNANVFCRTRGKIWWGDLDLACDKPSLERSARRLRLRLYVLSEFEGRFENAERAHSQIKSDALWQTGGPIRIPGLRVAMRESGLSPTDVALLLNVSKRSLLGFHEPENALKMRRRIDELQRWIEIGLPDSWTGGWGRWLIRPNPILNGATPLQRLRRDKELSFGKIMLAEWPNAYGGKGE
jgi:hypothetical protein